MTTKRVELPEVVVQEVVGSVSPLVAKDTTGTRPRLRPITLDEMPEIARRCNRWDEVKGFANELIEFAEETCHGGYEDKLQSITRCLKAALEAE